jgi:hypothetical protein
MKVDMSPRAVTDRLARVSAMSQLETSLRLIPKTDMSTTAVTTRLRQVSELRRLCLALGRARPK